MFFSCVSIFLEVIFQTLVVLITIYAINVHETSYNTTVWLVFAGARVCWSLCLLVLVFAGPCVCWSLCLLVLVFAGVCPRYKTTLYNYGRQIKVEDDFYSKPVFLHTCCTRVSLIHVFCIRINFPVLKSGNIFQKLSAFYLLVPE